MSSRHTKCAWVRLNTILLYAFSKFKLTLLLPEVVWLQRYAKRKKKVTIAMTLELLLHQMLIAFH